MRKTFFIFFAALTFFASMSFAEVPNEINYQGRLREYGQPVTGSRTMIFKLYAIEAGGVPVWSSGDVAVAVTTGTFSATLSPTGVDWRWKDFWLETTVSGKTLSPREKLAAGAYALHARTAEDISKTSGTVTVKIGDTSELAITTFTVSAEFNRVVNISTPTAYDDGTTKGYVDNLVSGSGDVIVGNEVTDTANATLTRSGAGTSGDPYKLALNWGSANAWSGAQTFGAVTNFRQKIVVGTTTANVYTLTHIENDTNDNSPYEILTLRRSRSDAVAPGAADFGTDIIFRLEGWSNNSDASAARIRSGWERAQNNDSTDRDSYISFATMADGNAATEKLRITSSGVNVTTPTVYDNVASKGYVDTWLPTGTILMWGGTQASIPSGWLLCDGSAISRATYARLFAAVGTVHGVGDGVTTFQLPNLRDRFVVGAGNSYAVAATGGADNVTLTTAQMPVHNHTASTNNTGAHIHTYGGPRYGAHNYNNSGVATDILLNAFQTNDTGSAGAHSHTVTVDNSGSGTALDIRPPYFALCYIIKN